MVVSSFPNAKTKAFQPLSTIPLDLPINTSGISINLATSVTGILPVLNGGTGLAALGTGVATWLGTPSSANLASAVTGETGSGALMFGTSPTITTSLVMADAANIVIDTTTGTKIGTATGQKLSLWNATPIIQPASANQAALSLDVDVTGADTVDKAAINTNFTAIQTLVNQLRTDLIAVGVIKGAA